jgi:ATP-dependent Clp protease ATP-binding subunit ClpB
VRIQDSALVAAATLSHRYISDRFARQGHRLVDEAATGCASSRLEAPRSDEERRASALEVEREGLRNETDRTEGAFAQVDREIGE